MTEKRKNIKNVPNLRFPGFEEEWEEKRLREFLTRYSETNRDNEFCIDDILSLSSIYGIIDRKEILEDVYENVNHLNYKKTRINDFVYGKSISSNYPYGLFKINNKKDGLLSTLYYTFKIKDFVFPMFLECYFRHMIRTNNFLRKLVLVGDRYITADSDYLLSGKIYLPSQYKEQQEISVFLELIEEKIITQKKTIEELNTLKRGLAQKIFSQELRFKDDKGNEFPEWENKKLNTLCKKAKSGGTPKSTISEYYDGNIPFLSISDMTQQGKYLFYTEKNISQKGLKNSTSWIIPINSIIYSMYASVGLVSINRVELATSQAVLNIIVKSEINVEYLYYYLDYYRKFIDKYITTGTQGNLNAETVKNFIIPVPFYSEQQKIANFLSSIDEKIDLENQMLQKLEEQKKYFLANLFI